mgnify:CR=1 FL=1
MKYVFSFIVFVLSVNLYGQNKLDDDPEFYRFYLVTVGPSPLLYSTSGHTLLRVENQSTNFDVLFNWGVFNSEAEGFYYKFFQQKLNYKLFVQSTDHYYGYHFQTKIRSIVEDELNLTVSEKSEILKQLKYLTPLQKLSEGKKEISDYQVAL